MVSLSSHAGGCTEHEPKGRMRPPPTSLRLVPPPHEGEGEGGLSKVLCRLRRLRFFQPARFLSRDSLPLVGGTMHLSEQNPNDGDSRVGTASVPAGAPVHEIEVTPAMIDAGAAAISDALDYLPEMSPSRASDIAERVISGALATLVPETGPSRG